MIRQMPQQDARVETGPLQFGDDWPGVFIRGDDAFNYMLQIKTLLECAKMYERNPIAEAVAKGMADMLRSCIVGPASTAPDAGSDR